MALGYFTPELYLSTCVQITVMAKFPILIPSLQCVGASVPPSQQDAALHGWPQSLADGNVGLRQIPQNKTENDQSQ